jgi:hypothetical protein
VTSSSLWMLQMTLKAIILVTLVVALAACPPPKAEMASIDIEVSTSGETSDTCLQQALKRVTSVKAETTGKSLCSRTRTFRETHPYALVCIDTFL